MFTFAWYDELGKDHVEKFNSIDAAVKAWHHVIRRGLHPTTIMPL